MIRELIADSKLSPMLSKITFFVGLILGLSSCSVSSGTIQYKEVKVPVACEIQIPARPVMTDDTVVNTIELITFTKDLEQLLKVCVKEK